MGSSEPALSIQGLAEWWSLTPLNRPALEGCDPGEVGSAGKADPEDIDSSKHLLPAFPKTGSKSILEGT